ncbi:hypothetical protein KTR9_3511 [Gordonia sp. KTR9]|nr:hypothetical protein KTR9_3511 [Gordonia sp. KTR9]
MMTLRTRPRRWETLETRELPTTLASMTTFREVRDATASSRGGLGHPVVVGVDGGDASLRAVKVAARLLGESGDLILICATRGRRKEASTALHDALKDESYLLSGQARVDECLRTAAELARWHGARTVSTRSEVGDPTAVLHRAAQRVGAGAVVLGGGGARPGWTARRLAGRLDGDRTLIVTDGSVHLRRRSGLTEHSRGIGWNLRWPTPAPGPA